MTKKRRKRHTPEQIVKKLRDAGCDAELGPGVGHRCSEFGDQRADVLPLAESVRRDEGRGSEASEGTRRREPSAQAIGCREGTRHSDAQARRGGKLVSPARKRDAAKELQKSFPQASQRRACRVLSQPRSSQRYKAKVPDDESRLVKRMLQLVREHPRFGYRRIAALLRREGWTINNKRAWRLWKKEGLKVPQKKRRKRASGAAKTAVFAGVLRGKNDVWSWDFIFDRTANGTQLKWLVIVDEFALMITCCVCFRLGDFPGSGTDAAGARVYTDMEMWAEIRRRVLTGEISKRAACQEYQIHWQTLQKILSHSEPPGYRLSQPRSSKLDEFVPIIHEILEGDRTAPRKQRHTAKRIFERLRDEHDYDGGETIVKDAVRRWKQTHREVFLPLSHPPGEAQVDFGFAQVIVDGEPIKVALFVMTVPYSDALFVQAFPRECTEVFLEGHKRAFEFFGGVPTRISYDNSKIAVAKITGSRDREAHEGVRSVEEPLPVRIALLPGAASEREGTCRTTARLCAQQLPGSGAAGGFAGRTQPATAPTLRVGPDAPVAREAGSEAGSSRRGKTLVLATGSWRSL